MGITACRHVRFLGAFLPLVALLAQPQERPAASIDLPADADIGIYYRTGHGWEEMLPEVVNWKTGGVLKHVATAGIVKGDVNGHLTGAHSRNLLMPTAEVVVYPIEGIAATEYQLLRLHENSDSREFRTFTGGVVHRSGGAGRDTIQFQARRVAKGAYLVLLPSLEDGEYGFLAPGALLSRDVASLGKIYTFRVGLPKGTTLTASAKPAVQPVATPIPVAEPPAVSTLTSDSADGSADAMRPAIGTGLPQSVSKPMTNRDVKELKTAGFSDEFVIAKIQKSTPDYQLDTEEIIALKKANVSEAVIEAMMAAASPAAPPAPVSPTAAAQTAPAAPERPANPKPQPAADAPKMGLLTKLKKVFSDDIDGRKPAAPPPPATPAEPPVPPEYDLTSVTILSKPAGARILVDGYPAGVTPSVVKLMPGTYKLTLQADGFPAYTQQITVEPGQVSSFGVALDTAK